MLSGLILVIASLVFLGFGVNAVSHLSADAFPDVSNVQLQIATEVAGKSPEEVERLIERRTLQDWVVRPLLRSTSDVAEINSTGGFVKQYEALSTRRSATTTT